MSQRIDIANIITGFFMLIGFHILAAIFIFSIAFIIGSSYPGYIFLNIIIYGLFGFSLWQLVYFIPLCLRLKNQDKISTMKGVIIAAIMTFLVNGGCFLLMSGGIIR
jgi:hypothetical protein